MSLLVVKAIRRGSYRLLDWLLGDYLNSRLLNRHLVAGDKAKLQISSTAVVNNAIFNLHSGTITIEDYVFFGHNVSLLTGTHDYRKFGVERGLSIPRFGRDIVVREGAWIATNVVVLGPCVIGKHAVVAAGSVVTRDVPDYGVVAGSPAKIVRSLSTPTHANNDASARGAA